MHLFGAEYLPRLPPVNASTSPSRVASHDSGPSGSLVLTRKALSSSASCRFSPAHCNQDVTPTFGLLVRPPGQGANQGTKRIVELSRALCALYFEHFSRRTRPMRSVAARGAIAKVLGLGLEGDRSCKIIKSDSETAQDAPAEIPGKRLRSKGTGFVLANTSGEVAKLRTR